MSGEKVRPLVAYALVALLCAFLLAIGMHTPQPQLLHQVQRAAAGQPHLQVQAGALLEPRSDSGVRPAEPATLSDAVNGEIALATPAAVRTVSGPGHHRAGHPTAAPPPRPRHHGRSHQRGHQGGHQHARQGHGPARAHGNGHGHAHPGGPAKLRQLQRWLKKVGSAPASPKPWMEPNHKARHHKAEHHGAKHHGAPHHRAQRPEKANGKAHHGRRWARGWHWHV